MKEWKDAGEAKRKAEIKALEAQFAAEHAGDAERELQSQFRDAVEERILKEAAAAAEAQILSERKAYGAWSGSPHACQICEEQPPPLPRRP